MTDLEKQLSVLNTNLKEVAWAAGISLDKEQADEHTASLENFIAGKRKLLVQ